MEKNEFAALRKILTKTQRQMAQILGISLKAVHSYEQGWRSVPGHVERQMLYLRYLHQAGDNKTEPCWKRKKCPVQVKENCPAWEFHSGKLCWFINGTICNGDAQKTWREKILICRQCEVLTPLLKPNE